MKSYYNFLRLLLIFYFVLISIECSHKYKEKNVIYFEDLAKSFSKWDELFTEHEIIELNFPLSYFLTLNSKGDYFLYSRKEEKIFQVDRKGNFVRVIAKKGEGPGEFQIAWPVLCDKDDNLYIHDLPKRSIKFYPSPDYRYFKEFRLKSHIADIILDREGNFITFSLYNTPYILKKYNRNGKILKETYKCKDETLRAFMARFNVGGIGDLKGKGFLLVYPDKYYVYFYNYNLDMQRVYSPKKFSKFYPFTPDFPANFSPYEFSSEHSNWWDKFLHPCDIYSLKDKYFMVVLLESRGFGGKYYINLHDLNGLTYARGLEVPYNGRIVFAKGDYVYVSEEETIKIKEEITFLKLHKYKLYLR